MPSHGLVLRLNRDVTPEEVEALYETGCADAGIETGPLGTRMDFDREAETFADALVSAVRDVEKVPELRVVGVECDPLVTQLVIAERMGVSREAVRLWATGERGPGGFPSPRLVTPGGEQLWDWQQVWKWLETWKPRTKIPYAYRHPADIWAEELVAADRVLAARDALRSAANYRRDIFIRLLLDNPQDPRSWYRPSGMYSIERDAAETEHDYVSDEVDESTKSSSPTPRRPAPRSSPPPDPDR